MAKRTTRSSARLLTVGAQAEWRLLSRRWEKLRVTESLWQGVVLLASHIPIRAFEYHVHWHVQYHFGEKQLEFAPRGQHIATVILGVGHGHVPNHGYWLARRLAQSWNCRVLILDTPKYGNVNGKGGHAFFHHIADRNVDRIAAAIAADYAAGIPIIGLGFSKGGQDVTVLAQLLLERGMLLDDIITLCTPWQGSRLWQLSTLSGGEHYNPQDPDLQAVEELGQALHRDWHVQYHFFCAWFGDRVVHRSDARFHRPVEDKGISEIELKNRWYYARTIPGQIGHTSLFYPVANALVGWEIRWCVQRLSRPDVQVSRQDRRQRAQQARITSEE